MRFRREIFGLLEACWHAEPLATIQLFKRLVPCLLVVAMCEVESVQAQSIIPATGIDGTRTLVTSASLNPNQFDISGGQLSGDRANLFHSLQRFGLNQNEIANFIARPQIQNILTRVVGGEPSYVYGLIKVTGGNSNLYLMNPAGILFGRTATVNVSASFTATTANGIGFGATSQNLRWFSATGANEYAALNGTPTTFAFTMLQPAAIVNLATMVVGTSDKMPGTSSLTLAGGTVLSAGDLSALTERQQIRMAAIPGQKLMQLVQNQGVWQWNLLDTNASNRQPQAWTLPALDLPRLLTGGNVGQATRLKVNVDGTIELRVEPDGTVKFVIPGQVTPLSDDQVAARAGFVELVASGDVKLFINSFDLGKGLVPGLRVTRLLIYPTGVDGITDASKGFTGNSRGGVVLNVGSDQPLPKSRMITTIINTNLIETTGDFILSGVGPVAVRAFLKTDTRAIEDFTFQSTVPIQDFPPAITAKSGNTLQQPSSNPSASSNSAPANPPSEQNLQQINTLLSCNSAQDESQLGACSRSNQRTQRSALLRTAPSDSDRILQVIDGSVPSPQPR